MPEAKAQEIFDLVAKFANYGFNKSHAACYAVVAYQTAYLKANYPVEFIAASMTYDMANAEKLNVFRQELNRLGFKLLPPDINASEVDFSVEDGQARYALSAVRNVGEAAMEAVVAERAAHGPFKDISDFADRLDPKAVNKRLLENLVKGGALDCLNANRGQVFEGIEKILGVAQTAARERVSDQMGLLGGMGETTKVALPKRPDWPPMEKLAMEFEAIGFYLSAHPLDAYATALERLQVVRSVDLIRHLKAGGSSAVKLAGTVMAKKERRSKTGNRYAFVELSDATGGFEVTFFSETLGASRDILESGKPVLVSASATLDEEDQLRLTAQSCDLLDRVAANTTQSLKVVCRQHRSPAGNQGPDRKRDPGAGGR